MQDHVAEPHFLPQPLTSGKQNELTSFLNGLLYSSYPTLKTNKQTNETVTLNVHVFHFNAEIV